MSKKRTFPDDWSNLTDDQVLENIEYLLKNYKKYDIQHPGMDKMLIGNVLIEPHGPGFTRVNKKEFSYRGDESKAQEEAISQKMGELYKKCDFYRLSFWNKVDTICDKTELFSSYNGRPGCVLIPVAVLLIWFGARSMNHTLTKKAVEKKVQVYEQTLPGYMEMKEQVEHYRDSLMHTKSR